MACSTGLQTIFSAAVPTSTPIVAIPSANRVALPLVDMAFITFARPGVAQDLHGFATGVRLWARSGLADSATFSRWLIRVCGPSRAGRRRWPRSEEHTSELQSLAYLVCRLLLEKKKK